MNSIIATKVEDLYLSGYVYSSEQLDIKFDEIDNMLSNTTSSLETISTYLSSSISNVISDLTEISTILSDNIHQKIWIQDKCLDISELSSGEYSNLSIVQMSYQDLVGNVINGTTFDKNTLYIVKSDAMHMHGQTIEDMLMPNQPEISASVATNKTYVDAKVNDIIVKITELSNALKNVEFTKDSDNIGQLYDIVGTIVSTFGGKYNG